MEDIKVCSTVLGHIHSKFYCYDLFSITQTDRFLDKIYRNYLYDDSIATFVIPAQAGIHQLIR